MSTIRAVCRLVAFFGWSLCCWILYQPVRLVGRWRPELTRRAEPAVCGLWARVLARCLGLRIRVEGTPPRKPFLLVCNHLGYIDIVTLMACAPGTFVSRGDVADWPFLGFLAKAANTIFVDRARKRDVGRVNGLIHAVLATGRGLILFPEGTSSSGEEVLPFRSSLLEPAAALDLPVSWAGLSYRTPPGSPPATHAVAWWGDMTFPDHFWNLLKLPRIDATLRFGAERVAAESRHELARELQRRVAAALPAGAAP